MKKLDHIDYKILDILQKDGRLTNQELARQVDLAPSSCLLRLRHLEEEGIISNYHARVDLHKVCRFVTCIAGVHLKNHTHQEFLAFKEAVASIPEIVEYYTVSGECDFILKIVCRDMPAYLAINDQLISNPNYLATINSYVVMEENKPFTNVDLDTLN
ncbi:Lrp/AsnC family transcriptional regulator [Marinomonas sp. C2222]|uniref:Lrp/AsnC family transcriptional regulator n=1 Tax=Marinomonas sargassi TaxID=2984494 RepID=A0ABT2YPL4_9GAMM|nr:Lrp/AsnC family transcriptional regulator [Marinomonas sargassi]MCV2401833.1 Lrp/AsnC family transcriptional regulator [Marinomonas sargassi]